MSKEIVIDEMLLRKYYLEDDYTFYQISRIFGVAPSTVSKKIDRYHIPRRKVVENKRVKLCEYLGIGISTFNHASNTKKKMYVTCYLILHSNDSKKIKKRKLYSQNCKECYLDTIWEKYTNTTPQTFNTTNWNKEYLKIKKERKMMFG